MFSQAFHKVAKHLSICTFANNLGALEWLISTLPTDLCTNEPIKNNELHFEDRTMRI